MRKFKTEESYMKKSFRIIIQCRDKLQQDRREFLFMNREVSFARTAVINGCDELFSDIGL